MLILLITIEFSISSNKKNTCIKAFALHKKYTGIKYSHMNQSIIRNKRLSHTPNLDLCPPFFINVI